MKNQSTLFALPFHLIAFLFLTFSSVVTPAQEVVGERPFEISYYDKEWKLVTDRKKADYFRHVFKTSDSDKVFVKDFYISGKPQFECFVTDYDPRDANKLVVDGKCRWYLEDGALEEEAVFVAGKRDGLARARNEYGGFTEGYFVDDAQEGPFNVIDGKGSLVMRMEYSAGVAGKFSTIRIDDEWTRVYLEEFSDPYEMTSRNWTFADSTDFKESGGFFVELSPNEEHFQLNSLNLEEDKLWTLRFIFSVEKVKAKVENGIVFGANGPNNLVSFTISTDGTFSIAERRNGIERPIIENKRSTFINRAGKENALSVVRSATGFTFRINNEVVHTQEAVKWYGGVAGIISGKGRGQTVLQAFAYFAPTEAIQDLTLVPPAWWTGSASGFIFSKEGFIVTNHHVIDGAKRIAIDVKLGEEWKSVEAEVVAFDAASDLAILKIDPKAIGHIRSIPYSINPDPANLGTKVFTLGFPETDVLGSELKFTEGSVSSRSGFKGNVTTYQISVPLHPGNSGGPLFNEEGDLIGVVNSGVQSMQNVSYGVKASYLVDMIKSMDNGPKIPTQNDLEKMSQIERIKALSELVVFIKVKD